MGVTAPTHQTTSVASPCLHNSTTTTSTTMTLPEEHLPRYFGKAGFAGTNPAETKKKGSGKGNWGQAGMSELEDYDYNSLKPRRRPLGPEDQIRSRRRGRHRVRRSPARPPRRGLGRQPPREDEYLVLGGYYGQY